MGLKKKAVLRVLEQSSVPLTGKQIRHRLGIRKKQYSKLKAMLYEMVIKGNLIHRSEKFLIAPKTAQASDTDSPSLSTDTTSQPSSSSSPFSKSDPNNLIGVFSKASKGYGFVYIGEGQRDIFVPEEDQLNAMNGDRVEVSLFQSRSLARQGRTKGRIVRIVERSVKLFLARLVRGKRTVLAMPLNENSSLPAVVILPENDLAEAQHGDFVEVALIAPEKEERDLQGKLLRVLSVDSVDELAFDIIVAENSITTTFSKEALNQAEGFSQRIVFQPNSGRKDLRDLGFVTIDGQTARDFDDAVFVEKLESGNYRLYVAIADVAHYVRSEQPIDRDAYTRGTSVYFPTHAIPMLPESLSNNLCSLKPGVNRLTLTCEMEINPQGEVQDYRIYESVIRSKARLVYEDVAAYLESKPSSIRKKEIQANLTIMHQLAKILEKKRNRRGAIAFSFPDYSAKFGPDGELLGIHKSYQSVSMKLIEQFMLEANETVARHCVKKKLPALYRVHGGPDVFKLEKVQRTLWYFGVSMHVGQLQNPKKINEMLKRIQGNPNSEQMQLLLLKSMALACYRTENEGHYGLAAEFYTHFTSPIRRYPDLIVHRALKAEIHTKKQNKAVKALSVSSEIADFLSHQERRAEIAERQSFDLIRVIFMENYVGHSLVAKVLNPDASGIAIELEEPNIECFVPLSILDDDYYQYDAVSLTLTGQHAGNLVRAGDRMLLTLIRTDRLQRKLEFQFESWLGQGA